MVKNTVNVSYSLLCFKNTCVLKMSQSERCFQLVDLIICESAEINNGEAVSLRVTVTPVMGLLIVCFYYYYYSETIRASAEVS